jgi:hypothetical protein
VCRTALFMTVQEHGTAYCRYTRREAVKLSRFLLSPYSLVWSSNSGELHFSLTGRFCGEEGGGGVHANAETII